MITTIIITVLLTFWTVIGGVYALAVILGGDNRNIINLFFLGPIGWIIFISLTWRMWVLGGIIFTIGFLACKFLQHL